MRTATQVALNGLAVGCLYGLIAVGVVLLYRTTNVVNVAHGQVGVTGVFFAWWLSAEARFPVWIAVLLGLLVAGFIGIVIERTVSRPLQAAGAEPLIIATLGILTVLASASSLFFGSHSRSFPNVIPSGVWETAGLTLSKANIVLVVVTVLLVFALSAIARTPLGLALKAMADDPQMLELLGLRVYVLQRFVWFIAAVLAGIAALFVAARLGLDPYGLTDLLIKALVAAVIGGLVHVGVTFAAAVTLGVLETAVGYVIGPGYGLPIAFLLVMVALGFLPLRWFGVTVVERA